MRIAILGWGSLIWNPKKLVVTGPWNLDGPMLPIEFARKSQDGRITLVILQKAKLVPSRWVLSGFETLKEARENLRKRECTSIENIGVFSKTSTQNNLSKHDFIIDIIADWIKDKHIDAVIWTDLDKKFDKAITSENIIDYLASIKDKDKETLFLCEQYVRCAPPELRTSFRDVIEKRLGWYPDSSICLRFNIEVQQVDVERIPHKG